MRNSEAVDSVRVHRHRSPADVAFTHGGATLGLIAGELLSWEITRGEAHPLLAEFNARRFR